MITLLQRVLKGRIFLFALLLFFTVPLSGLSPVLWQDATIKRGFALLYTVISGGASLYFLYGLLYNIRLLKKAATIPLFEKEGIVTEKRVERYAMPIRAQGRTLPGPTAFKMNQSIFIEGERFLVPFFCPFDSIPEQQLVRIRYARLGGPLMFKLKKLVVTWTVIQEGGLKK